MIDLGVEGIKKGYVESHPLPKTCPARPSGLANWYTRNANAWEKVVSPMAFRGNESFPLPAACTIEQSFDAATQRLVESKGQVARLFCQELRYQS